MILFTLPKKMAMEIQFTHHKWEFPSANLHGYFGMSKLAMAIMTPIGRSWGSASDYDPIPMIVGGS